MRSTLPPSGKFFRISLATAGLLTALLILVAEGMPPSPVNLLLSNALQTALVFWAAYCTFHAARRSRGYLHQLWFLFAAALAVDGAAKVIAAYYQDLAHMPAAAQWPSDVLIILWVTPAAMMFVTPSWEDGGEIDWRQVLDFAQVGVVALTAYLYFVYLPSLSQAHGPQMIRRILVVQLARDMAICAGFLMRAASAFHHSIRAFFRRMSYFFLAASAADLIFLLGPRTFPSAPNWMDITWCAPYLLAALFASTRSGPEEPVVQEMPTPFRVVFSLVLPACLPLLVLFMGMRTAKEQMTVSGVVIAVSFMVAATRLILTSEKYRRIANHFLQSEEARLRSESMFSAAFRLSPDAIAINEVPGGQFVEVNDSFTRLVGYTREEIIGRTGSEMNLWVDPDHRARVMAKLQEESEVREVDFYCRTKSGEPRIFQFSGRLIKQGGRPLSLTLARDITARKKAEEALRANEERFRTLIEDMHVGILLLGRDAEAKFANHAVLDMFELKRDQALGNRISQLYFTPIREDGTKILSSMLPGARAIESGQTIRSEVVGWRRPESNDVLWTIIDAIPQFANQGEISGVILSITDITEMKRAEEALRASEERFRTLVENLHVGIAVLGRDQEILFSNRARSEMYAMSREESLGKTAIELGMIPLNEDGSEMLYSARPVARAIASGQAILNWVMGWRLPASKDVVWIQGDVVPLFDENGELESVIAAYSDITKRKHAEEALRASEELFRTLVEDTPVCVALLGPNQEIQFVNPAGLKLLGTKREALVGKRVADLGITALNENGTEMPFPMRPAPRAVASKLAVLNEVMGWRLAGSNDILWIQGGVVPLFGENGELNRLVASFSDITERKKAEEALRASEELFRTLVENLHVGISLIGPSQEILFANRASSKMFGLREGQSLGKTALDLGMTPLDESGMQIPASMRPVARAIATKQPVLNWVMGWRLPGANDILWIQGESVPLFGKNGELKYIIAAYSNITERKKADEALRQLSTRLLQLQDEERRHVGRELHDVLAQSVMAVNLDLARVARSPVPLDKQAKHALADARSMLAEMSREIRTLSYTLHPPVLDELGLVSAIQEFSTGFSERSGITLEAEIEAGFGRLAQEAETALFRIVQESLSNIQRHSGSKTARIHLRGGTEFVELQVSDQGRGMDQINIHHGGGPGTRLGVGILGMRERMAQLGGRLEVESSSSGTTVRATLPLKVEVSHAAPDSSSG